MISRPPVPGDLCPAHRRIWIKWSQVHYNPRHPQEWPGGSIIMDNRTSHADREKDWERKTLDQLHLIERICRRGDSPQCSIKEEES